MLRVSLSVFLSLILSSCMAWSVVDRGDPFLDVRFRRILTISCLPTQPNESSGWSCPEHAECVPAGAVEGSTTPAHLCVCSENFVNPDPYQYGADNDNVTIIYD